MTQLADDFIAKQGLTEELIPDLDRFRAGMTIGRWVEHLIKQRALELTGDETHDSVRYLLKLYADVDLPREYDFQDVDVHEKNALNWIVPNFFLDNDHSFKDIVAAIKGERELTLSYGMSTQCHDCVAQLYITVKGRSVRIHARGNVPCEENHHYTVDVVFPTGEVICADWPEGFGELEAAGLLGKRNERDPTVNYTKGIRLVSERLAVTANVLHMFVGNTCPSVQLIDPTTIYVGQDTNYDLDTDEETSNYTGKTVGSICTDLWWATIVDVQTYAELLTKLGWDRARVKRTIELAERGQVPPGTWRFTSNYPSDHDENPIYAVGRLVSLEA